MRQVFIFFAAALVSAACASGPKFIKAQDVPPDCGIVYFYRPDALAASGQTCSIKWIETELGKLRNNSYFSFPARPGSYTFYYEGRYGFAKVMVDVAAGETYYVCGRLAGLLGIQFKLDLVHPTIGQAEIQDCRLSE